MGRRCRPLRRRRTATPGGCRNKSATVAYRPPPRYYAVLYRRARGNRLRRDRFFTDGLPLAPPRGNRQLGGVGRLLPHPGPRSDADGSEQPYGHRGRLPRLLARGGHHRLWCGQRCAGGGTGAPHGALPLPHPCQHLGGRGTAAGNRPYLQLLVRKAPPGDGLVARCPLSTLG